MSFRYLITTRVAQIITDNAYTAEETFNVDETAVFLGAGPKSVYMPKEEQRAHALATDDKARFTALLCANASGRMMPPFFVIKCTAESSDLSKSAVLDSIHKHGPYTAAEGWKKMTWNKTLSIRTKGTTQTCHYTRPYLLNSSTNVI
jgi:hypothetical protein